MRTSLESLTVDPEKQEHADEDLRQSETRFRAFVTASSDVVYRMSSDWTQMRQLVGRTFLSNTDAPSENWLDRYIHRDDQPVVRAAIQKSIDAKTMFELEHRVIRADGSLGWTFSRAVPIRSETGDIKEWLGTARDIGPRKRAEAALRVSEARLAADLAGMQRLHALHASLVGETDLRVALEAIVRTACEVLETDRGCIQLVSDDGERLEMFAFHGYGPDSPFIAHFLHEGSKPACDAARRDRTRLIIEDVATFPPLTGTTDREIALADGIRATQSTPMISRDSELRGVLSNQFPAPHRPAEEQLWLIDLLVWTAADFVARHKAERTLRESEERHAFLLHLTDALRPLNESDDIERVATRLLGEHLEADRCFLSPVYEDGLGLFVREEYLRAGASSVLGDYTFAQFGDFVAPELHAGRIMAVENVDALTGLNAAERATYAATQIGAYLLIPLVRKGRLAAFLTINNRTPRPWSDAEKAVARQTADRLWTARERARAETALRESEAKYRTLFETMEEGYGLYEVIRDSAGQVIDWRYLELNPAFERHSGMDVQAVVGHVFSELFPDTNRSYWLGIYQTVMDTQSSRSFEDYWAPIDRWIAGEASPAGGERFYVIYRDVTERKRAELALRESEERQAFLLRLSDTLRPLANPVEIAHSTCRLIVEHLGGSRAQYAGLSGTPGEEMGEILGEYVGKGEPMPRRFPLAIFGEPILQILRAGETLVMSNAGDDARLGKEQRDAFLAVEAPSTISVPLVKGGRWIAALTAHGSKPREWCDRDIKLIEEVAERTWSALERARAEAAMRESEALRRLVLDSGRMGTWRWDIQSHRIWGDPLFLALWGFPASDEPHDLSLFTARMAPAGAAEMETLVTRAVTANEDFDGQLAIVAGPTAGSWIRWRGRADVGTPIILYGVTFDITEQRRSEQRLREHDERQQIMVDELQHRTRNLLGVVRSIAGQTLRASDRLDDFESAFNNRLAALSRVQGLLSRSQDEPITMEALIHTELAALGAADMPERVLVEGPHVHLRKGMVQTFALALHELATNARKYGALATETGRLRAEWRTYVEEKTHRLVLEWREIGLVREREEQSPVTKPDGYGRELIERALPYALQARTTYELSETDLLCTIDLPLTDHADEMA